MSRRNYRAQIAVPYGGRIFCTMWDQQTAVLDADGQKAVCRVPRGFIPQGLMAIIQSSQLMTRTAPAPLSH